MCDEFPTHVGEPTVTTTGNSDTNINPFDDDKIDA